MQFEALCERLDPLARAGDHDLLYVCCHLECRLPNCAMRASLALEDRALRYEEAARRAHNAGRGRGARASLLECMSLPRLCRGGSPGWQRRGPASVRPPWALARALAVRPSTLPPAKSPAGVGLVAFALARRRA